MADHPEDWRITEGPAFGVEPAFDLSDIRLRANFHATGAMSRSITARLTTATPTRVESLDRTLPELGGFLRILDDHPERSVQFLRDGAPVPLGRDRGVLKLVGPDRYDVYLYLPTDQFARLLPMLAPPPLTARLRIEVERTLDQGVVNSDAHFWNDHLSPVILFNEFEISLSGHDVG